MRHAARIGSREVSSEELLEATSLFKVLSHPDRLRLACSLGDGRETTQSRILDEFGWPQSTAARHIAALRAARLLSAERHGAEIRLRLASPVAHRLFETVCAWVHEGAAPPRPSFDGDGASSDPRRDGDGVR